MGAAGHQGSGQAQATAQTNFAGFNSVQTVATSQVSGTPASAIAQAGGASPPPSNAITAGQSFSNVSGFNAGLLSVALGSMGAGGTGGSFAYHTSVNLTLNAIGGPLLVDLLGNTSLGTGFDNATFQIKSNGSILDNEFFTDLASAQSFFSNNLLLLPILAGLNDIQMTFDAMMSGGQGFGFNYAVAGIAQTPLPPSLIMMLSGLVMLGLLGWRRKRKAQAAA